MANGIKAGKVDPKITVRNMLETMSPQQKTAIKQLLPQIKKVGKQFGVSEKNLNLFITELNGQL